MQSDIQARLADINRRTAEARANRDRQFWSLVAYIWIVAIGIVFVLYSMPRAMEESKQIHLAEQENVFNGKRN